MDEYKQKLSVSIIIASYNYADYLGEAIESVLSQTWTNFELLIIDDGSYDNSVDIATLYKKKDSRVRVLMHSDKENHGIAATIALGILNSRGDYIAFLESDDIWSPQCIEKRMLVASVTNAGVIFNDIKPLRMFNANTDWFDHLVPRLMKGHAKRISKEGKSIWGPYEMRGAFLIENQIPTFSCAMFKREGLLACRLDSPIAYWLDRWIWCQVAQQTNFAFIPEKLTSWRLHAKSFTERNRPSGEKQKTVFAQYIKPNVLFWKSLRERLLPGYTQGNDWIYRYFLRFPVWVEFVARFIVQMKNLGFQVTIKNIIKKFY